MRIINIIREIILNMDGIRQERPNEGPIWNFNERLYRQSLNKKFGTHVRKIMVFKSLENYEK